MPRALLALCAAVICFAGTGAAASATSPGTWYVSSGGHDTNICDSTTSTCATIAGALAQASPGDSIIVGDGTYTDPVTLPTEITLEGWSAQTPDVQGLITVDDAAAPVTINGLTFSHGGGIEVDGNTGSTTLTDNTFNHVTGSAIVLTAPTDPTSVTVSGNTGSVQAGELPITTSGSVTVSTNGAPNAIHIDNSSVEVSGSPTSMTTLENPNTLSVTAATGTDLASASLDVAIATNASATQSPIAVTADPSGGTTYSAVTLTGGSGNFAGSLTSAAPFATTDSLAPSVQLSAVDAPSGTTTISFNLDQLDDNGAVLNTIASSSSSPTLHKNSPPVNADQSVTVPFNTATTITLSATDPDTQDTAGGYAIASGPSHGTANVTAGTNLVTYTPTSGYSGPDAFTFTATDAKTDPGTPGTVSITVSPDSQPVANNITVSGVVPLNSTGVHIDLSQGTPGQSGLTYYIDTTGTRGTVTLTGSDAKYVPPTTGGSDSFTYWASDGTLTSDHKTVSLTVDSAPVFTYPTLQSPAVTVAHYTGSTPNSVQIPFAASDAQNISYSVSTNPVDGTATSVTGGTFKYTPTAGYTGTDSFVVTADDGLGGIATATVNLSVTDQAPTAASATVTIPYAVGMRTISLASLNPTPDPDGDPVSYALVSPHQSFLTLNSGVVTVSQTGSHETSFTFTYTVTDVLTGSPKTSTTPGTVTVNANTPPTAIQPAQPLSTDYHKTVTGTVGATDPDSGQQISYQRVQAPAHASYFHFSPSTHTFTYTPANGFAGADSFTFEAFDGLDWSTPARVSFTVSRASSTIGVASISISHPTSADQPIATVKVTSAGNEANGLVTIKTGGFGTPTARVRNGKASIKLPQFPGGAQSITAVFAGTATTAPATSNQFGFTVTKVASKIAFKTNPLQLTTSTSNATATVTVTAGPLRPSGGVVTIDEKGNRLAQGTPKVGVVTLRLPQFALGQHNLTVGYTGTDSIASSSVLVIERVSLG